VQTGEKISNLIAVSLLLILIGAGSFFANRNLRLGRGDRRGATRLAFFAMLSTAVWWIGGEHHVPTFWEIYHFMFGLIGAALVFSALLWIIYVALEPSVRRRWPHMLVSWTRLLGSEWRDPLVGRDVLVGCAAGIVTLCLFHLAVIAPSWFGRPVELLIAPLMSLQGTGLLISFLAFIPIGSIADAAASLFLLLLLRILLRNDWLAFAALVLVFSVQAAVGASSPALVLPAILLANGILLWVLMRYGFVALLAGSITVSCLRFFPVTLQFSAWYSGIGLVAVFVVLALSLYGFRVSLGSRPLMDLATVED